VVRIDLNASNSDWREGGGEGGRWVGKGELGTTQERVEGGDRTSLFFKTLPRTVGALPRVRESKRGRRRKAGGEQTIHRREGENHPETCHPPETVFRRFAIKRKNRRWEAGSVAKCAKREATPGQEKKKRSFGVGVAKKSEGSVANKGAASTRQGQPAGSGESGGFEMT